MKRFKIILHWQSWNEISLGISVDIKNPNVEIHLPFLFAKLGWVYRKKDDGKILTLRSYNKIMKENLEKFKKAENLSKNDAEIILTEVIDDLYLDMKDGFADGYPHKLGLFKEKVKYNFNEKIYGRKE